MKCCHAVLFALALGGCLPESRQGVVSRDSDAAPAAARPQQRMNSLRVTGEAPAASQAANGNRQTMSVKGGATGVQSQHGRDNSQTMNVQASGGNVSQRQSGSGNSQSMNIGVTDDSPAPRTGTGNQ